MDSESGIDVFASDRVGVLGGDLLDVHAALLRDHRDGLALTAIHGDADVEFVGEVDAFLDEYFLDCVSFQVHAEDVLGGLPCLDDVGSDLDAPGFAAATDVYLCFDRCRKADLLDCVHHLFDGRREPGPGRRNPGVGEDALRLVLVKFHFEFEQ